MSNDEHVQLKKLQRVLNRLELPVRQRLLIYLAEYNGVKTDGLRSPPTTVIPAKAGTQLEG